MTAAEMVREFHEAAGLVVRDERQAFIGLREIALRASLIREESDEAIAALWGTDVAEVAKELADIIYVTYGTALHYGFDLDAVLAEVHASNMRKLVACEFCEASQKVYRCSGCASCLPYSRDPFSCGECGSVEATVESCEACNGRGRRVLAREDGKILKPEGWQPPDIAKVLAR